MLSLPFLVFSPSDRPLTWICQADRWSWAFFGRRHHGQGRVTTTDAPHLQRFSKPPYEMLLSLSHHVKKDKIRSLKTGRRKNETKTELRNHH